MALAGSAAAAALLRTAQEAVAEFGGARPGDKTLLDALDSARVACVALPADATPARTLRRAADAARAGAAATAAMDARIGRASRLGDKARGAGRRCDFICDRHGRHGRSLSRRTGM
ncbi:MAG: DAK2 domain-containing protein [Candidatus Binatia bacterium]